VGIDRRWLAEMVNYSCHRVTWLNCLVGGSVTAIQVNAPCHKASRYPAYTKCGGHGDKFDGRPHLTN
jgi:hypothetical protein